VDNLIPRRNPLKTFADRLIERIEAKGTPCVVGLDPRIDLMPRFITKEARRIYGDAGESIRYCINEYHKRIIRIIAGYVPAVKPQSAFFEQYGIPGIQGFTDTVYEAKRCGLLVIADAKRNDISSTAQAYANAFIGTTPVFDVSRPEFNADCITVSPYLGSDSLSPFVETCKKYGKGIFVLVKTSNPGSSDLQDLKVELDGKQMPLYMAVAGLVNRFGKEVMGKKGYSSISAVVGATFPEQARELRKAMPNAFFLVPGYGAQGGTAEDVVPCFNEDGLGAVVSASRSITYNFKSLDITEAEFDKLIEERIKQMVSDVNSAIKR
jgi:orotidine-5'-phosphate decarboxylase